MIVKKVEKRRRDYPIHSLSTCFITKLKVVWPAKGYFVQRNNTCHSFPLWLDELGSHQLFHKLYATVIHMLCDE
jgi:hypothetical protein